VRVTPLLAALCALVLFSARSVSAEAVGENLVTNGGFERGREGWGGYFRIVEGGALEGNKACVIESGGKKKAILVQSFVPLKPRRYYKFSMAVRRTTGDGYLYVHCNYYRAPGERLMSSKNWSAGGARPVTVRTGEATGRWKVLSGTFRCIRPEFGGVQLVIFMKSGRDTIYLDDIQIRELRLPEAPPWKFPDAVIFAGKPSAFGMAVERVAREGSLFEIQTTGAVYSLDASEGLLRCKQRIGKERDVLAVKFDDDLADLRIAKQDEDVCVLRSDDIALGFQGDSLITIASNRAMNLSVQSSIAPRHFRSTDQHLLAIDDFGGFCIMGWSRPMFMSEGSRITEPPSDTEKAGWELRFRLAVREIVGIAVFPPKHFDWERSFRMRIVNTSRCPEPDALRAFRKYANVLFLFGGIYRDQPEGYCHAPYHVRNPEKLKQTIAEAHKLNMLVICYRHPTSYSWAGLGFDEMLADVKKFRDEYGFDGWYLDGLPYLQSWLDAYKFIRILRERVGDGIIYTHCTLNPPVRMTELYCPFIDAYSDFLLRGEGQTIRGTRDPYLRYVIATYNISNSFATLKGDKMLRDGAEEPTAPSGKRLTRKEWAKLWSKVRCPLRDRLDVMLRLNGRCRWAYPQYPFGKSDIEDYIGFYFKELDRMQAEWERTGKPIRIRWGPGSKF